jgi:hypothetical protein
MFGFGYFTIDSEFQYYCLNSIVINFFHNAELVTPNKSGAHMGYRGWAYCACTKEKDLLLLYFEKGCPRETIRGMKPSQDYNFKWFNPRAGRWIGDYRQNVLISDRVGRITLPDFPADDDWGLCLVEFRL